MSCLNLQRILVIGFLAFALAITLSGCSATSALTGLIGSKPDMTAQVGAENVKQGVGVSGKVDQSSKVDTTIRDSNVGKVDTSNGKRTSASSITADTIKADKIEIRNEAEGGVWGYVAVICLLALIVGIGIGRRFGVKEKGA